MRGVILAAVAAVFVSACASTVPEERDPFYQQIAIGRWSHMMSQVADLTGQTYAPAEAADDTASTSALSRRLQEIVHGFNGQRAALCAQGRFAALACGGPYTPSWLGEDPDDTPGYRTIAQRSRNVGERIMPLWDAVCDDARSRAADEEERRLICAIE